MTSSEQLSGPPALVVGGYANSVAIARSLAWRGIKVHAVTSADLPMRWSRAARRTLLPAEGFWKQAAEYLLGSASDIHEGAVLFLNQDDHALSVLIEHHAALAAKFKLPACNPVAQNRMLDKMETYVAAKEAGVATPKWWTAKTELEDIAPNLSYPVLIKPRLGHLARTAFQGRKHLLAMDLSEARAAVALARQHGIDFVLMELIPGDDNQLCSYYSYIDEDGQPLFDFTKRVIRRQVKNMGIASYHVTDHVSGLREPALRLCRKVGLRGPVCVEFKSDPRDGRHKLIECNARFTDATRIVSASGIDLAEQMYRSVTGLPISSTLKFRDRVRLWNPVGDIAAFRDLRSRGEISWWQWVASLRHRKLRPLWSWRDPMPSIASAPDLARALLPTTCKQIFRKFRPRRHPVS